MEEIKIITKGKDLQKIGAKEFLDFISPFVKEKAYLSIQKKPTLAEERKWLDAQASAADKKNLVHVLLFADGKMMGNCAAIKREPIAESDNVHFGLAIAKSHRGKGWGEKLLRIAINEAKKRLKPRNMWIEYTEGNEPAKKLYEKVGFMEIGRLEGYHNHYGKLCDKMLMVYRGE